MFTPSRLASAIAFISISYTNIASAQQVSVDADGTWNIPETVVTATRLETPIKDVIGDITVITEKELKAHQGQTLAEVLNAQPAIQIKTSGSQGSSSSIFLRGAQSNKVLLLVDGIRLGSATLGTPSLESIPANEIGRIEILHGSSATSIYGADAIGGVIQVFTKAQAAKKSSAYLSANSGTQRTKSFSAGATYATKNTRLSVNGSKDTTEGISSSNKDYWGYENDKDGNENKNLNLSAAHKFSPAFILGASYLTTKSDTNYDNGDATYLPIIKNKVNNATIWSKHKFGNASLKAQYGVSKHNSESINKFFPSEYETEQEQALVDFDYRLPVGKLLLGYQGLNQEITSTADFSDNKRSINSYLLGYQFAESMLQGQLNVRRDDVSNYGNETSYSAGLALIPFEGLKLGASFATGFRLATFNDLYTSDGNPNLKPENTKNTELFVAYNDEALSGRLSLFKNKIDNQIAWEPAPTAANPYRWTPVNKEKVALSGASIKTALTLDNLTLNAYYDYLNAKDDITDNQLFYRAKNSAGISGSYKVNGLGFGTELDYLGERYVDPENTEKLPSHFLVNIFGSYKVNSYIDINARVNNVFDKDYTLTKNYNTLGRNALLGVNFHTK